MTFFIIAIVCVIISIIGRIIRTRSINKYLGEWFYDGESDTTFWRYFPDIEVALKELDQEFPGYKARP